MYVINARNVNDAYRKGLRLIAERGESTPSRNGPVLRVSYPVTTIYENPTERVLFDAQRNANPFFHLFEGLWMLNGQNDVATMTQFIGNFGQFSDDGVTLHGAYGYRWRNHFSAPGMESLDQLDHVIGMLGLNPDDRRAIVAMWDPEVDLGTASRDIPCNDLIKFNIVNGRLNMQVYNRSNDIVFGAYGANAVHMSMLQEYIAGMLQVPVGRYWQISGDYHAYVERPYRWDAYWPLHDDPDSDNMRDDDISWRNPYDEIYAPIHYPLVSDPRSFDEELRVFMRCVTQQVTVIDFDGFKNTFFSRIAYPMYVAHRIATKKRRYDEALLGLQMTQNSLMLTNDWLAAGIQWLTRRIEHRMAVAANLPTEA